DALAAELELLPKLRADRELPLVPIGDVDLLPRGDEYEARLLGAVAPELVCWLVRFHALGERLVRDRLVEAAALEVFPEPVLVLLLESRRGRRACRGPALRVLERRRARRLVVAAAGDPSEDGTCRQTESQTP